MKAGYNIQGNNNLEISHFAKSLLNREISQRFFIQRDYITPDLLKRNRIKTLFQRDLKHHTGCVNAIDFSPDENFFASGIFIFF